MCGCVVTFRLRVIGGYASCFSEPNFCRVAVQGTIPPAPNPERLVRSARLAEHAPANSALPLLREIGGVSTAVLSLRAVKKTRETALEGASAVSIAASGIPAVFANDADQITTLGSKNVCRAPTTSDGLPGIR